jgi:hypothetical protein
MRGGYADFICECCKQQFIQDLEYYQIEVSIGHAICRGELSTESTWAHARGVPHKIAFSVSEDISVSFTMIYICCLH